MPIYAPSLPPRPTLIPNKSPILVLARFDLARIWRLKLGRFFGLAFFSILVTLLSILYAKHLVSTNPQMGQIQDLADQFLPQQAAFQASLLHPSMLFFLWLQVAMISGGLIARDTMYRIRPLIYAHPVRPQEYIASKALTAFGIPFCIQLPFIVLPWLLSMLIAGPSGPVWPIAPLLLVPAAALNALVMASITVGASSLANTPKAGMGWVIGLVLGPSAIGGILSGVFDSSWMAMSPLALTQAWPSILCGADETVVPIWHAIIATAVHAVLWAYVAKWRTVPSEAAI